MDKIDISHSTHALQNADFTETPGLRLALLTGIEIAGFKINVSLWFKRFAIMTLGPYLAFATLYFLGTFSWVFALYIFLPVTMAMAVFNFGLVKMLGAFKRCVGDVHSIENRIEALKEDTGMNCMTKSFMSLALVARAEAAGTLWCATSIQRISIRHPRTQTTPHALHALANQVVRFRDGQ